MAPRRTLVAALAVPLALALADARPARSAPQPPPGRWADVTPDARIAAAAARALESGVDERQQLAALAVVTALSEQASSGKARATLERLAREATLPADVRGEAALLARALSPDEGTPAGSAADHAAGVVQALSILGPFRDTGGGLQAHDGPETKAAWFVPSSRYSWGTVEVAWRPVPRAFAQASGVPLDVFIAPRKESCTWLATRLTFAAARSVTVRVASTGQVRLALDGVDLGRDEDVHEGLRFNRVAAQVEAAAGDHLLAAKVCSGALDDDGLARLRVTDEAGGWPPGVTESANLAGVRPATHLATRPASPALARALGKPDGDPDARLGAAILRTLGGADDLRSPRAPGLLAALTDGPADADRLATAAWIAPSGANRSAWLHRAHEGGDARTRGFVARRLVERHLQAKLPDWAMAALRGAGLDAAGDAEAALLTARVELALGTDALRVRAMRRLRAAAQAGGAAAPDAVLVLLAAIEEGAAPGRAVETREALAARGQRGPDRVRLVAQTRGRAELVAAARAAMEGGVGDGGEALEVAQAVARAGAHDEARALFEQLSGWAPNQAAVWAGLAEELGAARGDATAGQALSAALRRARELEPAESRYRAEIALRAHAHTADAETHDDDRYLVPSQVILARRATAAPASGEPPDAADRQLHSVRAVIMHADRRVSEMYHYAREIVIAPRTEEELYENMPALGDLTEILRARVHRRDGSEVFALEEASDNAQPRIRWPELTPGDVVEVAVRSWTAGPVGGRGDPPFYRLDYAGATTTHPLLYNEDILESPPDRPIYAAVINGKADHVEERTEGGRHVVRYVWDHPRNVPDEPLAPPLTEVVPMLVMSTFKDWDDFRTWYGEAIKGFTDPDAQVRELAAKLTRGKATQGDKVRALFDFVADDIRYVNYVSGEWWLPNRPQQLLARREGDCDDKALLLITLLRATGIEAREVMVQTRQTAQPSLIRARGAAIPLFDHGIAFLPGPGGGTYLDATSPQSRLGPLPSMDARAVALRMDGPAEPVDLPASSPEDHGVDSTWTIELDPSGGARVEGRERASGDDAFWQRTYLTEPGARAQWLEERLVGTWFPTMEIDKKVEFRGDLPRGQAEVTWRARSDGLARREGSELVVPLSPAQPMAAQIAPLLRRELPVWLPPHMAPRKEARTLRVVAPKGWRFQPLPQGGEDSGGSFGRARLEVSKDPRDPRAVLVRRTVTIDQSTISVDEYPRWRAWIQRVDALMHKTLRLEPAAGGGR